MPSKARLTSLAGVDDEVMLTIAEAAAVVGLDYSTMLELTSAKGTIPFYRLGRRSLRIKAGDLRAWIESCRAPRDTFEIDFRSKKR